MRDDLSFGMWRLSVSVQGHPFLCREPKHTQGSCQETVNMAEQPNTPKCWALMIRSDSCTTSELFGQDMAPFFKQVSFLSWPWPPNAAFVWDTSRGKKSLWWWWPHQPATGALPQEVVISSPMEHSPLPNCYLIVSLTSPFPPLESCLCRCPCLNPFLVRLLVLECS